MMIQYIRYRGLERKEEIDDEKGKVEEKKKKKKKNKMHPRRIFFSILSLVSYDCDCRRSLKIRQSLLRFFIATTQPILNRV